MTQSLTCLSIFSLTMIAVGSVDSIRNLPTTALFGSQLIAFSCWALCFNPGRINRRIASGWPMQGIYIWVKEAFGKRMGFSPFGCNGLCHLQYQYLQFVGGTIGF